MVEPFVLGNLVLGSVRYGRTCCIGERRVWENLLYGATFCIGERKVWENLLYGGA